MIEWQCLKQLTGRSDLEKCDMEDINKLVEYLRHYNQGDRVECEAPLYGIGYMPLLSANTTLDSLCTEVHLCYRQYEHSI